MNLSARVCGGAGAVALLLTIINQLTAAAVEPALQRSSALAALAAVGLMLVGVLWTRAAPVAPERADLQGEQGLLLRGDLGEALQRELDWGTRQLLQATPAAVVMVVWRDAVLVHRGLLQRSTAREGFASGPICRQAQQRGRSIHLVDLRHYPGRDEFEPLLQGLPSIIVQPIGSEGLLLLGGWSARCFSSGDEAWLDGWAQRLRAEWLGLGAVSTDQSAADAASSERASLGC